MDIQTAGITSAANPPPLPANAAVDSRKEARPPVQAARDSQKNDADTPRDTVSTPREEVEKATDQLKKFVSPVNSDIQFSIDEDTGITVVKVVDKSTNEIIRQIPGDEVLQIAKALDRLQGLLVKQQA